MIVKILEKVLAVMMILLFSACQEEITEIIEPSVDESFDSGSTVSDLVQRTSLIDGSIDNIIDGSSCTRLVLPVVIEADGVELTIQIEEDFAELERILNQFDDDDDIVEIKYPVTIVLADYSEIIVNDDDDLERYVEGCVDDGSDDDIECIDFRYPFEISVYDAGNQVSDVLTITSDKQLYDFVDDLDDDLIAAFNFPIVMILSDSSELVINNQDQLEKALENAIDDCDEDDDSYNYYDDDDEEDGDDEEEVNDQEFVATLIQSKWIITSFIEENDTLTQAFEGYIFTFLDTGEAQAEKDSEVIVGSWKTSGDEDTLELELNFGEDEPFDEMNEDWYVLDYTEVRIRLGEEDDDSDTLVFERAP